MSEPFLGFPDRDAESGVEGQGQEGVTFSGETGEREVGDTGFSGEMGERSHEGRENISAESGTGDETYRNVEA